MTLFLTVGVRDTNHRDEFHITTFFRVRFAKGASLLVHWSFSFGVIQIRCSVQKLSSFRITFGGSIWTRGIYFTDCTVIHFIECSRPALVVVFLYGGNIPFVVSLCFASQRTPTVCAHCAGSISTIGLRSFLLKVSGVSSHLNFCCTSLVSGFIIHARACFVYSQSAQWIRHTFSRNNQKTVRIVQISGRKIFPAPEPSVAPGRGGGAVTNLPKILGRSWKDLRKTGENGEKCLRGAGVCAIIAGNEW